MPAGNSKWSFKFMVTGYGQSVGCVRHIMRIMYITKVERIKDIRDKHKHEAQNPKKQMLSCASLLLIALSSFALPGQALKCAFHRHDSTHCTEQYQAKCLTCSADSPTKTNLNGKVLARLRSTAGTNLVPQTGLARSSSSLSGDLQLAASSSISPVPSIGRLGSMATGPPSAQQAGPCCGLGSCQALC